MRVKLSLGNLTYSKVFSFRAFILAIRSATLLELLLTTHNVIRGKPITKAIPKMSHRFFVIECFFGDLKN